jgi:hypothetical protein
MIIRSYKYPPLIGSLVIGIMACCVSCCHSSAGNLATELAALEGDDTGNSSEIILGAIAVKLEGVEVGTPSCISLC